MPRTARTGNEAVKRLARFHGSYIEGRGSHCERFPRRGHWRSLQTHGKWELRIPRQAGTGCRGYPAHPWTCRAQTPVFLERKLDLVYILASILIV